MVISDHLARRKAHANMVSFCPKCGKPYFQAGNYKPEDVCQCKKMQEGMIDVEPEIIGETTKDDIKSD